MVDYYSVLHNALSALDRDDPDARYELYERARHSVVERMRNTDPPWPEADIARQVADLDDAIRRLEAERAPPPRPRAGRAPIPAAPPPSPPAYDEPVQTPAAEGRRLVKVAAALVAVALIGIGGYFAWSRYGGNPASVASRSATPPTRLQPSAPAARDSPQPPGSQNASFLLRRQRVYHRTTHPVGTIIISRSQRFLYLVQADVVAIRYGIGVGPECAEVAGLFRISEKVDSPGWGGADVSPEERRKRDKSQPFGARAIYFGNGLALHGTTEPDSVGQTASFGCFHLWNEDIIELYNRVPLQERVVVMN